VIPVRAMLANWRPPRIDDPQARRGLWFSFLDGILGMCMVGLVETNTAPALLSLSDSKLLMALLASLPLLLSALTQLATPVISAYIHSRKGFVIATVWSQTFFLTLIALSGYYQRWLAPVMLVVFFSIYATSGGMGGSVWTSWMADMVPHDIRGRFFAWRNRYFSIFQVTAGIASGYLMQHYGGPHPPWFGYLVLYLVAALARFFSGLALWKQYEPPLSFAPTPRDFSYTEFLSKTPTSNFARFTIFVALVHGTTAIAGPFFNVYFLTELHIPHATFAMIVNANLIGTLLFLPFWGKVADHYGNWFVTRVTAFGIAAIPLPYLFAATPTWLWILNFVAGALWCGFGLATFNYLLEAVTPQRRVRCAAYMASTVGFTVFFFGLSGGWLARVLPPLPLWQSGYQTLFAVSSLLRFTAVGVFVGFALIREIRNVKPANPTEILAEFPGVRLTLDFARNAYRVIRRI